MAGAEWSNAGCLWAGGTWGHVVVLSSVLRCLPRLLHVRRERLHDFLHTAHARLEGLERDEHTACFREIRTGAFGIPAPLSV